jgi:hypothetical protein
VKNHCFAGMPIKDIRFHSSGEGSYLMSADTKICKVFDVGAGGKGDSKSDMFVSIEPPADINDLCVCPGEAVDLFGSSLDAFLWCFGLFLNPERLIWIKFGRISVLLRPFPL